MSKLFNLREWLTVGDAARHLSIVFGEEVTAADVLRLGLDGQLKLSVNFVNHTKARCGKVVGYDETEWQEYPEEWVDSLPNIPEEAKGKPITVMRSLNIDDERFLNLSDEITTLRGVWDLPMIGNENLDIEHEYQNMTGGPAVTLQNLEGTFVERRDGEMCKLQESFDNKEFQAGSTAELNKLKYRFMDMMLLDPSAEGAAEAEALLDQYKENRKAFLKKQSTRPAKECYYPAGGLPKDAVIVVRTEVLRELEQSMNGKPSGQDKPLLPNERITLLTIIAALSDYSDIAHQGRGAAKQIEQLTIDIGAHVTEGTVLRHLSKIPDALQSRMK